MRVGRGVSALSVVALILLGAQASQTLHDLVVPHEICLAHGETVEADGDAGSPASLTVVVGREHARLMQAGGAPHAHDQCLAAPGDGDAVVADTGALAHALPPSAAPLAPATTSDGRLAVPLFRLAPKNSPPV